VKLGLLGFPVAHSLSPGIHGLFLRECCIEGSYELLPTPPESLPAMLELLRNGAFHGLNVTMPYKRRVFELCDQITTTSNRSGVVNTVKTESGLLLGHNTDTEAFSCEASGLPTPFLIVGAGGVSRAVSAALKGREYSVFARTPSDAGHMPMSQAARHLTGAFGTVVNATPLGWRNDDPFPLTPPQGWTFMDLNYNPGWRWRNELPRNGVTVITGESMLVRQAALSFSFWTGITVRDELFRAALNHVRRFSGDTQLDR
jgi:shikimate dehydrogenase